MEFIDHTGHIFSLPTFDDKPVAIQYTENDYIFWVKDNPVSINNYYILPIRFLLDYDEYITKLIDCLNKGEIEEDKILEMKISLNSNFYKLIGPKYIQSKLEQNKDINEPIEFDLNDFKEELTLNDFYFELSENSDQNLIVYNGDRKFLMFPFYVIGKSSEEGTYLSNIQIHIKTFKEESGQTEFVWLTQDQMYDYLMKKTFNNIKIYEIDENTGERTLWYSLENGYDSSRNEIITVYQTEYKYRIRNWSYGLIKSDVYHYIYRLPKDKWLQPGHKYMFSGYIKQSCHYCGSILIYNHDGYMTDREYYSCRSWVPTQNCLLDLNGDPYYEEAYDRIGDSWIPKADQKFHYGTIPNAIYEGHSFGDGFHFTDNIFTPDTTIRDFFFDVDNKDVTENKDGGYVEYTYYNEINKYTQLTVGCTFIDECEELIINGKNMGINLPKEILKAIYSSSFYNKYADEKLIKSKMKELLLNYMSIKGECGNFKSVINSLKWFGWADKIEISKLIKTDNEFQNQYILDYFTITTDLKDTYKYFNTTNLISLSVKGNQETGEYDVQDFTRALIGEGKPLLEDLFDKNIEVTHDDLKFYKPYYDFLFNELALKLDCLSYYWQKYFLPIHLKVNRASIEYKVYANDMKLSCAAFTKIIEKPVIVHIDDESNNLPVVEFPDSTKVLYNKSIHYIDSKFNEFSNYNEEFTDEDLYYVNENCIVIPIKISDLNNQFSLDPNGDYFLIDEEYIRPFKFFRYNPSGDYLEEVDDVSKADYYQLYYNTSYEELSEDIQRYSKITTGYYSCKIFLSYIDNETNEEKYLVKDNVFNFYQNINQYYTNYVIIPRLIKDKSFDWLNTYFRLAIVINNKWYTYDFTVHTPNIYLDLGKLNYRYYIGEDKTMFNQINKMTTYLDTNTNQELLKIDYKSFLYQPDLVSIDTLFYNKDNAQVLTFIQKLIETNGDQNQIYDFYKKYYQNSIQIPYNKKYFNKVHIFDLCKRVDIDDIIYNDLPEFWGDPINGDQIDDEDWNSAEKVIQFLQEHPEAYFESGTMPNFSNPYNVTSTLAEEFIYDFDFPVIGINNVGIRNSRDPWDLTETDTPQSIDNHGTFEDGIRAFAKWMLVDLYAPEGQPRRIVTYVYHIYEFEIYDDNHNLIYHAKSRKSVDELKQIINEQIHYRMWNYFNLGLTTETNPYTDWKLSETLDPYKVLHYYDAIKVENPESTIQNEKYEHAEYSEDLNFKESQYYKLIFNNDGTQKLNINEDVEYDVYLMHDNVLKENKYWYGVLISKYPISNYTESELEIHQEEYLLDKASGLMLKYSGYSIDKFLVNRMDVIPTNGYNHFNKDDLIVATINNNNYQFNIDLSSKWIIQRSYDPNSLTEVESNTNMVIIPNNNIDSLYSPGYYDIQLNYTINGLNDQLYTINGKYLVSNEISHISYPVIHIVEEETRKISIDTIISDFSILYENVNGTRKSTPNILKRSSGYVPIGIKIVNAGYFAPDSPDIYMGLKLMCCGDPDNGFSGEGSTIYYMKNGTKVTDRNPFWGFSRQNILSLPNFSKICYTDETKSRSLTLVYPQTDDPTKAPTNEDGTFKYPAPNNRGFKSNPATSQSNVNLLNDDDTINQNLIDDTCAFSDWNGKDNTARIISEFDESRYPNWRTSETIPNEYIYKFSPAAACCWRYHTATTNQGDWYLPSFAEVFFVTYNFKKYSEVFEQLSSIWPEYCKPDLISCIGNAALWSSTSYDEGDAWEIHPCAHAHNLSRSTSGWYTIPYIHIQNSNNGGNGSQNSYLKFTLLEAGSFTFNKSGIQYSTDNGKTWNDLEAGVQSQQFNSGQEILWKGNLTTDISNINLEDTRDIIGVGKFSSNCRYNVSGNICSLINSNTDISGMPYVFFRMFKDNTKLIDASNLILPDSISEACYYEMFKGCTFMTNAPQLPSSIVKAGCYTGMFENCTSLTLAPELPATTLATGCYYSMFKDCSSIFNAPQLPATELADVCYHEMFSGCVSLMNVPNLPAMVMKSACYAGMFRGCQALQSINNLPATTLADNCYNGMFQNCINLVNASIELPATIMMTSCYEGMFSNCYSLTNAPILRGETLAEMCYGSMFSNCLVLERAPELNALELVNNCYYHMFEECKKLNYLKAMFLSTPSIEYMDGWVMHVSLSGTFVKNANATWPNKFELYAIPGGWNIITE